MYIAGTSAKYFSLTITYVIDVFREFRGTDVTYTYIHDLHSEFKCKMSTNPFQFCVDVVEKIFETTAEILEDFTDISIEDAKKKIPFSLQDLNKKEDGKETYSAFYGVHDFMDSLNELIKVCIERKVLLATYMKLNNAR